MEKNRKKNRSKAPKTIHNKIRDQKKKKREKKNSKNLQKKSEPSGESECDFFCFVVVNGIFFRFHYRLSCRFVWTQVERRNNLSRFEGSTGISSSDYFGGGGGGAGGASYSRSGSAAAHAYSLQVGRLGFDSLLIGRHSDGIWMAFGWHLDCIGFGFYRVGLPWISFRFGFGFGSG